VRVHFIIGRNEGETPKVDRATLDGAVEAIVRSWIDDVEEAIASAHDAKEARALFTRYRDAFPIDYREVYPPATAIADIAVVEALTAERPLGVELYREAGMSASCAGLKSSGWPLSRWAATRRMLSRKLFRIIGTWIA